MTTIRHYGRCRAACGRAGKITLSRPSVNCRDCLHEMSARAMLRDFRRDLDEVKR